jgi:TonB family protein
VDFKPGSNPYTFLHLSGNVRIQALIDTEGRVNAPFILRSSGFCPYDAQALQIAKGWRFSPAQLNGHPIERWWNFTVAFRKPDDQGIVIRRSPEGAPVPRPPTVIPPRTTGRDM